MITFGRKESESINEEHSLGRDWRTVSGNPSHITKGVMKNEWPQSTTVAECFSEWKWAISRMKGHVFITVQATGYHTIHYACLM